MIVTLENISHLLLRQKGSVHSVSHRCLKRWPLPPNYDHVVMPENRKLPILDPVPQWPSNVKALKSQKKLYDMRGPELVHNDLLYKQYGIIALSGGRLNPDHINMIRNGINKNLDESKMFAVWRIDAPWKPFTKRSAGKKLGGGKPGICYYVTPVRAGRVILEMGGRCEFEEVIKSLNGVVYRLPFDAMAISHDTLSQLRQEEQRMREKNVNPVSIEYCIKNNILNIRESGSWYDQMWHGKYI